jgi:hypothetical protein
MTLTRQTLERQGPTAFGDFRGTSRVAVHSGPAQPLTAITLTFNEEVHIQRGRQLFVFHFNYSLWRRLLEAAKIGERRRRTAELRVKVRSICQVGI